MKKKILLFLIICTWFVLNCYSNQREDSIWQKQVDRIVTSYIDDGEIPGVSCVIVKNDESFINNYGYSNIKKSSPVTSTTIFELGSCSKAFTALAIRYLVSQNQLDLNKTVKEYIPWFKTFYKGSEVDITISQLLYHTSGIPWKTLALIPQSENNDALLQTVKVVNNIELNNYPGETFEYASMNYNLLAFIIEKVTNQSFEAFVEKNIFMPYDLKNTSMGNSSDTINQSTGYKISFFKPREYVAPSFRGNYASGYVNTNALDMSKWLKIQMGLLPDIYDSLIAISHLRDDSVFPLNMNSYASGWNVSLKGDGEIFHSGLNPNYSTFISFSKKHNIGVVILSNSNSVKAHRIGQDIIDVLSGRNVTPELSTNNSLDKGFSVISILLAIYLLFVTGFIGFVIFEIAKKRRAFERISLAKFANLFVTFICLIPFMYGIYILPKVIVGFSWAAALVWAPSSFPISAGIGLIAIAFTYISYLLTLIFPSKNEYIREAPKILLLSILSGLANMVVILLITSSFKSQVELKYILFYFALATIIYLLGRKVVQTRMIYITRNIIYDLRVKLINKIFSTSYEKFEKIDRGRIYATMNDDIGTIGASANTLINVSTSIITAGGAFIYMATLAFWATFITVALVGTISIIYYFVSRGTQVLFEDARGAHAKYMGLLNGMIDGFKELSIHRTKKMGYKSDLEDSTDLYRRKISLAHVKFVNAFLIGESLLILVLGTVSFLIPRIFPSIQFYTVLSFIIILLYLIGPVNAILSSIPQIMQLKVAMGRVKSFLKDIPANMSTSLEFNKHLKQSAHVQSIQVKNLVYAYKGNSDKDGFSVGPINFEIQRGEIIFIIGGNGSGKTTLSKLITGLYSPKEGQVLINGQVVSQEDVGEYYSAVFNPLCLFEKLYDTINTYDESKLNTLLTTLRLKEKVSIDNNKYSTIDLSGGQRKRLALLQCFLEDKPIYLFDEWAADQDPEYRRIFYKELLVKMRDEGKIVIAITHDDHYFDVADKILKLDQGKIDYVKEKQFVEG